jgi:enoyl-[acyl-carrier protein] reductase I
MTCNLLKGKKGIIFGALNEMSIAWQIALKAHEQGAELILTNTPMALRMGKVNELAEETGAEVVPADATDVDDIGKLFEIVKDRFGGVDFLLHSIGMSPNVRKGRLYDDLNYDFLLKTLDISALSFHKILQTAKKMDAIKE